MCPWRSSLETIAFGRTRLRASVASCSGLGSTFRSDQQQSGRLNRAVTIEAVSELLDLLRFAQPGTSKRAGWLPVRGRAHQAHAFRGDSGEARITDLKSAIRISRLNRISILPQIVGRRYGTTRRKRRLIKHQPFHRYPQRRAQRAYGAERVPNPFLAFVKRSSARRSAATTGGSPC